MDKNNLENNISELRINLREIQSMLSILNQAINNEYEETTMTQVVDSIELIKEKVTHSIVKADILYDNLIL